MIDGDFRNSAAVALDDIDTIKRRQTENWEALQVNNAAIVRSNTRIDALDRGQIEILKRLDANSADTATVLDIVQSLKMLGRILDGMGRVAKPLSYILGAVAAGGSAWAVATKLLEHAR